MPVGWHHSYAGIVKKAGLRRARAEHWRVNRRVASALLLPPLPRRRTRPDEVWAVFLVKNEADILEHTLRHAAEQGIDRLLVVDNGSTDGTRERVAELSASLPVILGDDREPAYYQSAKMTRLARWAASRGAGWVVPMDADEFWFARDRTVADFLRSTPADIVEADLYNLFPTEVQPTARGLAGELRFDHARHLLKKTALRAHPLMWLSMGNHEGLRPGSTGDGLFIAHVPWRSEEQYLRKVRQGAAALAATNLEGHLGGHWRRLGRETDEGLRAGWRAILRGDRDDRDGWNPVGPFTTVRAGEWSVWSPPEGPSPAPSAA